MIATPLAVLVTQQRNISLACYDFYPENLKGFRPNSANFYLESADAFPKFLAKFYPDKTQGVEEIIGVLTRCDFESWSSRSFLA